MRWVIGDIHGLLAPLRALLDQISRRDSAPRFLFVGDYVNRGPDSKGVIDLLLSLTDAHFVRGNHDDVFDFLLNGQCYCDHPLVSEPLPVFRWFAQHGLIHTLTSYGVALTEVEGLLENPSEPRMRSLLHAVPASHRRFMRELPAVIEQPDLFVVHGSYAPDQPDDNLARRIDADAALRYAALWGRFSDEVTLKKHWSRTGYFGHSPVQNYGKLARGALPIHSEKIVLLDTAAALIPSGRLSAINAENGALVQVDPRAQVVKEGG